MAEGGQDFDGISAALARDLAARADFRDYGAADLPDAEAAYAVQGRLIAALAPAAGGIGGRKIAFNTAAQMEALGLSEPGAAVVLADVLRPSPAVFDAADWSTFTVEPEIAAVLGRDLAPREGGWTAEAARDAVAELLPAFEILERRRIQPGHRVESVIAANIFNAGCVLGGPGAAPSEVDPATLRSVVEIDGEVVLDKVGGAPMDPFEAVAFLADRFNRLGQTPKAGEVLLLGAHLPPTQPAIPSRWRFSLGALGDVAFEIA